MKTSSKLKVALCDLRHRTMGLHSYQMPLGIGLMAAYVLKHLGGQVEIRLYKYYDPFMSDFDAWAPDVVGASFYSWNRKLTLHTLGKVRQRSDETLTLLGGPELEIESASRKAFLAFFPFVDMCCFGEGEGTLLSLLQQLLKDRSIETLKSSGMASTFYLNSSGELKENSSRPPLASLDEIPSPYTTGLFDSFFRDYLHPFIESQRRCPFSCKFCHMGLPENSYVTFQSVERTLADLEYCAQRYQGRHDIQLCIGDNNFGMYAKDVQLSEGIRRLQEQYDWPRYLVSSTGKDNKERMIAVSQNLKWGLPFNMAVQSLNSETLKTIGRKNVSLQQMRDTLDVLSGTEFDSYTELIMSLPHETRESFEQGLKQLVGIDLNWLSILTLRHLNGTWLTLRNTMEEFQFDVRRRVICRQLGEYDGKRIIESEGCVVASSTMSYEDYLYLREITYILQVIYNSDAFNAVRRYLREIGADVWAWIQTAHALVLNDQGRANGQLRAFMDETAGELFDSEAALEAYFQDDAHFSQLLSGEIGDNLINKYSVLAFSDGFESWLGIALESARKLAAKVRTPKEVARSLSDIEQYIRLIFDFYPYFQTPPEPDIHRRVRFERDIPAWTHQKQWTLERFTGACVYDLYFTRQTTEHLLRIQESSHDISFSIQRIYRDKNYHDLIPNLERVA